MGPLGAGMRTRRASCAPWMSTLALVAMLCCCAQAVRLLEVPDATAEQQAAGAPRLKGYRRSGDLGVSQCTLQGVMSNVDVLLHVWLRVVPPNSAPQPAACASDPSLPACGRTALVRGAAFLQDSRHSVPFASPMIQMVQSQQLQQMVGRSVYLRSPVTGNQYPLVVRVPPPGPLKVRLFPTLPKARATNHVIDITGELVMDDLDAQSMLDLELRVDGFAWYCNVLVEPPTLRQPTQPTPSRSVTSRGQAGLSVRPSDIQPWTHLERASLTKDTQVWVLLAPFHNVSTSEYALTLWHHVLWHRAVGVTRYLLYVTERLGLLLKEPLIQSLISEEVLEVVLFMELSKHEHERFKPDLRDKYAAQVLQLNHAVLSLWGSDTLVLPVDLDEYLVTPAPGRTAVDVFRDCAQGGGGQEEEEGGRQPLAGMQLHRYEATCRKNASSLHCDPHSPNRLLWLSVDPADVASGAVTHPVAYNTFQVKVPIRQWDQKAIMDPGLALDVHVHDFAPGPGSITRNASRECARLLHLLDFYSLRHKGAGRPPGVNESVMDAWHWPAATLKDLGLRPPRGTNRTDA